MFILCSDRYFLCLYAVILFLFFVFCFLNIAASDFLLRRLRGQKHSFSLVAQIYCLLTGSRVSCPIPTPTGILEDINRSMRETFKVITLVEGKLLMQFLVVMEKKIPSIESTLKIL